MVWIGRVPVEGIQGGPWQEGGSVVIAVVGGIVLAVDTGVMVKLGKVETHSGRVDQDRGLLVEVSAVGIQAGSLQEEGIAVDRGGRRGIAVGLEGQEPETAVGPALRAIAAAVGGSAVSLTVSSFVR